ncbi:MAG: hypothetical protein ABIJ84_01055 [bacterium]
MMTKKQKAWLWVFIAMFAVPEILFLITPLSILSFINNFSEANIKAPIYYIISQQFFTDYPVYVLLAMIIEWLGVLGLLIYSFRSHRKATGILLVILLAWLSILIYLGYVFSTMSPVL